MKSLCFFLSCCLLAVSSLAQVNIIPKPVDLKYKKGSFKLMEGTSIYAPDSSAKKAAAFFNDYLQSIYGFKLKLTAKATAGSIRIVTSRSSKTNKLDFYDLDIATGGITISGNTPAASFYAMQSLIQILPAQLSGKHSFVLPAMVIKDYPRFSYRGMHLDVCRHFFPVSFVKKYIDYLALHKLNYFHWHLTDDQGWRIEIKKYPLLTETGAWRNGTIIGRYPGTGNDNLRYGGYYTQKEVQEVIAYAASRFITIVPEIEMPGHASAAIAAYPYLSCFANEPTIIPSYPSAFSDAHPGKHVQETWGVFDDVFCAGNDSTYTFLEDVLTEVSALFPSQFIHVGGDECPKSNWKRCPKCQQKMRENGLKDEHELQSYLVQRMEKFLNAKGKILIGWDEILEGGLAPNAMVMSWRGEKGGMQAASAKHNVIMTPERPVYFDHTQTKNEDSLVIGGYNPLEAVYAWDPLPKDLDPAYARYILGGQANLWTEYIAYPSKVEYMIFPRMSALSEVLWSQKAQRSWQDFEQRLQTQFARFTIWKASYSKAYYELRPTIGPANGGGISWRLQSNLPNGKIVYQRNDETPQPFRDSIRITTSGIYTATLLQNEKKFHELKQSFVFTKSTGRPVGITASPNPKYPGQGSAFSLVNGVYSTKGLSNPDWLGWVGDDIEAVIDLGSVQSIDSVRLHTLNQNGSWIYLPRIVEVEVSDDGMSFQNIASASGFRNDVLTMGWINVALPKDVSARYLRVRARNYGTIPDGKAGGGNKAWLFCDEIQVF